MDAGRLSVALAAPPFEALDPAIREFVCEALVEAGSSCGFDEVADVLAPYLVDAGLATDADAAQPLCDAFAVACGVVPTRGGSAVEADERSAPVAAAKINVGTAVAAGAAVGSLLGVDTSNADDDDFEDEAVDVEKSLSTAHGGVVGAGRKRGGAALARASAAAAAESASAPGAELQLRTTESSAEVDKIFSSVLPDRTSSAYLAATFVSCAEERQPGTQSLYRGILSEVFEDACVRLDEDQENHDKAISRIIQQLILRGILEVRERVLEVGDQVLVVLPEDGEWHPAVITEVIQPLIRVTFLEYGKPHAVASSDVRGIADVVDDDAGELEEGSCEMCKRLTFLTFHHLIPKDTHRKYVGKRLPPGVEGEPTRCFLNRHGTMICRSCHSMVHSMASNETLGAEYNTLEKLLAMPGIQSWIEWRSKNPCRR
eukprot:TRINITY_DN44392_c0_g1_i1.p1 TRINITY_DN44392_c0_g1~~TRINITY_DN44392_c0_g1_i1.p1  ORF type:complete len:438 (+),score=90.84 TRINITY_DN44392_c0_g1_i1:25-1314(+)